MSASEGHGRAVFGAAVRVKPHACKPLAWDAGFYNGLMAVVSHHGVEHHNQEMSACF